MASDPDAVEKGAELVERGEMQWLPTSAVAGADDGLATVRSDTTERAVRNRLLGYPRLDVDEAVARTAGRLLADADDRSGGHAGVGASDASIAAMAAVLDDVDLTDDASDFEAPGVPVETY